MLTSLVAYILKTVNLDISALFSDKIILPKESINKIKLHCTDIIIFFSPRFTVVSREDGTPLIQVNRTAAQRQPMDVPPLKVAATDRRVKYTEDTDFEMLTGVDRIRAQTAIRVRKCMQKKENQAQHKLKV